VPKIELAIKDAITRGADRRIRLVAAPLHREVHRLRRLIAQLRRDFGALRVVAREWQRAAQATPVGAGVSEDEVKAARFSARLIQKLRARLGLSQMALGRLVGVSGAAVVQWERGRASPSEPNRKALVALRKRGRREVKRLLERGANPARTRQRRAPKRARRRRRRGGR
jgi:DNA-binding transcriptional regulator YiaG